MKYEKYFIFGIILVVGIYGLSLGVKKSDKKVVQNQTVELKNGDTYNLEASYVIKEIGGKTQTLLAYNGSIPGPTIRVVEGSEVTINFKNSTDMPQLLHSHGVRMENAFDGSQAVQKEMQPGESFSYKLKFPDAGVYWYHPHVKEVYGQGRGLYGAFVVNPTNANYWPKVNQEVPVFLSDLPIENGKITLNKNVVDHSLMGHYGNVMFVNGEESYTLHAKQGEIVRLYVINSANVRPFNFALKGLKMKLVGGDSGAYEEYRFVDSVLLGPSERAVIDVLLPNAGSYEIQNKTPNKTYVLGNIIVGAEKTSLSYENEFNILQKNSDTIKSIDPFRSYFTKVPDKNLLLTVDMGGMMTMQGGGHTMGGTSHGDGIEWEDMGGMMSNMGSVKWHIVDRDTNKKDMDIDWKLEKNKPIKIRIFNDPNSMHPMQHPIHFHGQRFLVVARNGMAQTNLVWKDTVLVKTGETVDIILDPSNIGIWMVHCHISEHLEAGMMFGFEVR